MSKNCKITGATKCGSGINITRKYYEADYWKALAKRKKKVNVYKLLKDNIL